MWGRVGRKIFELENNKTCLTRCTVQNIDLFLSQENRKIWGVSAMFFLPPVWFKSNKRKYSTFVFYASNIFATGCCDNCLSKCFTKWFTNYWWIWLSVAMDTGKQYTIIKNDAMMLWHTNQIGLVLTLLPVACQLFQASEHNVLCPWVGPSLLFLQKRMLFKITVKSV